MRFASLMKVLKEVCDNPFLLLLLTISVGIVKVAGLKCVSHPALLPLNLRGQASPKERKHD